MARNDGMTLLHVRIFQSSGLYSHVITLSSKLKLGQLLGALLFSTGSFLTVLGRSRTKSAWLNWIDAIGLAWTDLSFSRVCSCFKLFPSPISRERSLETRGVAIVRSNGTLQSVDRFPSCGTQSSPLQVPIGLGSS